MWLWMFGVLVACDAGPAATPARPPTPIVPTLDGELMAPDRRTLPAAPEPPPDPVAPSRAPSGPVVCGLADPLRGEHDESLRRMARNAGVRYPDALVSVANAVHRTGRLPDCYVSKRDAEDAGWRRGEPLWSVLPGKAIGGDRFGNYERNLPTSSRGYVEADLDDDGQDRNAHRLVFENGTKGSWRMWVTTDHYRTFVPVDPTKESR